MSRVRKYHNKYQVKRHEESIKHQTKLKRKEKPKVVRNGDDETGMLGIWNLNPNIKPQQPKQILPHSIQTSPVKVKTLNHLTMSQ